MFSCIASVAFSCVCCFFCSCFFQENGAGGRFRWSLGRPRQGQKSLAKQMQERRSHVEQWKRDSEQWADHGFKVLGMEIGHLPESQQVALLAGGVFSFLLIYGYMQVRRMVV